MAVEAAMVAVAEHFQPSQLGYSVAAVVILRLQIEQFAESGSVVSAPCLGGNFQHQYGFVQFAAAVLVSSYV